MDSRNFLSAIVRGSVAVGLVATSGYLLTKKGNGIAECNSICNGCKTLQICTKPEAIQVKRENTQKNK